ncbi:MAG: CCA tRNA nucleotidyltransferase [Proteobacteria bacterium]|nr:CCA tRNA nucleotidyltransferase [Pseudomonadota bacterium]
MTKPARRVAADWLASDPLRRLLATLDRDGENARVVGGAVRNALLGAPPGDIDIATTAPPQDVMRRATAAGFKPVPTGIAHGTVTVVIDGQPFEVTTLREDVETFGRQARVEFGRDWRRDAERRDFTINALSMSADGTVHDYVGGIADLERRRVRFIGVAAARIAEDYLRILRFFRFHAAYGHGAPDTEGLRACIRARAGLERLSRERVSAELMKLMLASRAAATLEVMSETGLLVDVLGGVALHGTFAAIVAREEIVGVAPDALRRLGALAVSTTEDAARLAQRLRFSNAAHARLAAIGEGWWRVDPRHGEARARAILYRLGPQVFTDQALLSWSRSWAQAGDPEWASLATLAQRWTPPRFPLRAADFLALGAVRGPALGAALAAAETAWVEAQFPDDDAALARIAARALATARADPR